MLFRSHVPRNPLCNLVAEFRSYDGYVGRQPRESILPSGVFGIMFNLRRDEFRIYGPEHPDRYRRFSGAIVSGPYAGPFISDAADETSILGIHFKPGGAFPFLGFPADELTNTHVDLTTIWGAGATELRDRLCALSDPMQRFELLEQVILARLSDGPVRHGAVRLGLALLTRTYGRAQIRSVASAVNLSQRRFIEVFAAEVGLTPKLFGRVQRFQRAAALSKDLSRVDWAELAVGCGYFDQAHLIRDFVEFAGVSPNEYWRQQHSLQRAGAHVKRNHLPMARQVNFVQYRGDIRSQYP